MAISKTLLAHVSDGDLHTRMNTIQYSTNLREIITVGYMVEQFEGGREIEQKRKASSIN